MGGYYWGHPGTGAGIVHVYEKKGNRFGVAGRGACLGDMGEPGGGILAVGTVKLVCEAGAIQIGLFSTMDFLSLSPCLLSAQSSLLSLQDPIPYHYLPNGTSLTFVPWFLCSSTCMCSSVDCFSIPRESQPRQAPTAGSCLLLVLPILFQCFRDMDPFPSALMWPRHLVQLRSL